MNEVIEVGIVEDDRGLREVLQLLLDGTPGFHCRAAWGSVEEALLWWGSTPPQVLLLDINLPGRPGSEAVGDLVARFPGLLVVMLTMYGDDEHIFTALCNGACGYLLKKTPPARILEAIGEVAAGGAPMSPEIARKVVRLFREGPPSSVQQHGLTEQELRLLQLLAGGDSYQAAAQRLGISINTVRTYVRSIYDKLHVHSKSEAVSKAIKARII
jgi:DNA-binding NarL/FixJ family response regulator